VFKTGLTKWELAAGVVIGGLGTLLVLMSLRTNGLGPSPTATGAGPLGRLLSAASAPTAVQSPAAQPVPFFDSSWPARTAGPGADVRDALKGAGVPWTDGRRTGAELRYLGAEELAQARQELAQAEMDESARREALFHLMAAESLLNDTSSLAADASRR